MRLFRLELKRILKSRRTLILLAIALLLSVAMAYLPISYEGINRPNEDGTVTELDGLAAIKYKQVGFGNLSKLRSRIWVARGRWLSSDCIY